MTRRRADAANVLALGALIASLLSGNEKSGGELLLKGATIWWTRPNPPRVLIGY